MANTTPQNVKVQGGFVVHRATAGRRPYCNPNRASSDTYRISDPVTCKRCLATFDPIDADMLGAALWNAAIDQ